MLELGTISGNIHDGKTDAPSERLRLSRLELQKSRLRKSTDSGTDVGLSLDSGVTLRDGDILTDGRSRIVIEQIPEKVMTVRLKSPRLTLGILVGHIIGNRHRPVSVAGDAVSFPIQSEAELEIFERLLAGIPDTEIKVHEAVFEPHAAGNVADHG